MKKRTKKDLIEFLETIANSVGKTITEYHWREAVALISEISDIKETQ